MKGPRGFIAYYPSAGTSVFDVDSSRIRGATWFDPSTGETEPATPRKAGTRAVFENRRCEDRALVAETE
jgi:hypothetical protein